MSKADEVMRGLSFHVDFKGSSDDEEYRKILKMIGALKIGSGDSYKAMYFEEKAENSSSIKYRGIWFRSVHDYVGKRLHESPQVCLKVVQHVVCNHTVPEYELVVRLTHRMIQILGKQLTDLIEYVGKKGVNYEVDYINYHGLDRGSLIRDWTSEKVSDAFIGSNPLLKAIDPEAFGDKYKVNIRWHQSAAEWLTYRIAVMPEKEQVKLTCGVYEKLMARGMIPRRTQSGQLIFDRATGIVLIENEALSVIEYVFNKTVCDEVCQLLAEKIEESHLALEAAKAIVTGQVRQPHKWRKRKFARPSEL